MRFKQTDVDLVRKDVLRVVAREALKEGRDWAAVRYVWFPQPRLTRYELKLGNPPPDSERPEYLRGLRLEIDCTVIPRHIAEILRPGGKLDEHRKKVVRQSVNDKAVAKQLAAAPSDPDVLIWSGRKV